IPLVIFVVRPVALVSPRSRLRLAVRFLILARRLRRAVRSAVLAILRLRLRLAVRLLIAACGLRCAVRSTVLAVLRWRLQISVGPVLLIGPRWRFCTTRLACPFLVLLAIDLFLQFLGFVLQFLALRVLRLLRLIGRHLGGIWILSAF